MTRRIATSMLSRLAASPACATMVAGVLLVKRIAGTALIWLGAACATGAEDPNGPSTLGGTDTTGRTSAGTTTTAPEDSSEGGEGSGASSQTSSTDPTDATSAEDSTGVPTTCGDGTVDLGEQCDDGNASDFDDCTTQCTVPTCTDGIASGMETDVDCGGPCQACQTCAVCTSSDDCAEGLVCDALARCSFSYTLDVDWLTNCPSTLEGVVVPDLPAGDYRAVALGGGGAVWSPPHDPPNTGYSWMVECAGISLPSLRTPAGIYYATPDEALANLIVTSEAFTHAGGDLICYRPDSACIDNVGGVSFRVEPACP